jgi:hypothetical protein
MKARHDAELPFDRSGKHIRDDRFYSYEVGNDDLSSAQSAEEIELSYGFGRSECFPKAAPGRIIVRKFGTHHS